MITALIRIFTDKDAIDFLKAIVLEISAIISIIAGLFGYKYKKQKKNGGTTYDKIGNIFSKLQKALHEIEMLQRHIQKIDETTEKTKKSIDVFEKERQEQIDNWKKLEGK